MRVPDCSRATSRYAIADNSTTSPSQLHVVNYAEEGRQRHGADRDERHDAGTRDAADQAEC
ncbi:MAG: hypothetical protein M3O46_20190, partial [Myxococcota bacterium]|nr:hypothetical protein [Myxococcota bacterium]